MEEKKNWKERLGGYDSMEGAMFVTIDEKTVYAIDELKEFIQQELDRAREETFTKEEWDLILYAVSGSANKDTGAYDEMCDKFDNEYGEPKNETVEAFDKLLDKVEQLRLSKLTTK